MSTHHFFIAAKWDLIHFLSHIGDKTHTRNIVNIYLGCVYCVRFSLSFLKSLQALVFFPSTCHDERVPTHCPHFFFFFYFSQHSSLFSKCSGKLYKYLSWTIYICIPTVHIKYHNNNECVHSMEIIMSSMSSWRVKNSI